MKRIAGGLALAAGLLVAAPAALAADVDAGKSDTERRLEEVLAELEAQRLEINGLKTKLSMVEGGSGVDSEVKRYLESADGQKALGKGMGDMGFLKVGTGTIKFGLLLQWWYTSQRDTRDSAGELSGGQESFRVRRAEMKFSGTVVKDLVDWEIMTDPARALGSDESGSQSKRILQDFKIIYKGPFGLPKDMSFTVGQFKTPFGHDANNSTSKLELVDRSEGDKVFSDTRLPGAMAAGTPWDGVEWKAAMQQGRGQNSTVDVIDQKIYTGRVGVHPLALGGGDDAKARGEKWGDVFAAVSYSDGASGKNPDNDVKNLGFEGSWMKKKVLSDKDAVTFLTEWFNGDVDKTDSTIRSHYYQAGYQVNDEWQVVGRQDEHNDKAKGVDTTIHTVGVNYFIKSHNAKIGLDYIRKRADASGGGHTLTGTWILQFQVAF